MRSGKRPRVAYRDRGRQIAAHVKEVTALEVAKFNNGMLTVHVAKSEATRPKQIDITVA